MLYTDIRDCYIEKTHLEYDVFEALIHATKDKKDNVKSAAIEYLDDKNDKAVKLGRGKHQRYLAEYDVNVFIENAKADFTDNYNSFFYRFFIRPFRSILIRLSCRSIGLNGKYIAKLCEIDEIYVDSCVAILMAGIYLILVDRD